MKEDIERLMREYRTGGISRRRLAIALSAATATVAAPGVLEGAVRGTSPSIQPPSPAAVFVPPATGGGADDFQAIQDTIDAAAAAGGGQVSITEPLAVSSTLTLRAGVELVGAGRSVSSIAALPTFSGSSLVRVEDDAAHAAFYGLTLDGAGQCPTAVVEAGPGTNRLRLANVRLTGWDPGAPEVAGVDLTAPPDPGGSDRPIHDVVIEGCELDDLGNGVRISGGAEHLAILGCRFLRTHRRGIWLSGATGLSSRYVEITGNVLMDAPLEAGLGSPIELGAAGDSLHGQIHLNANTVLGNGSYGGPGGLGTGDSYWLRRLEQSQVICNVSVDSGGAGLRLASCNDVVVMGNAAIASDGSGFVLEGEDERSLRVVFVGNYAQNNGQNRGGASLDPWEASGFLIRDRGAGALDTHLISNYSWDDQGGARTQNYALALADDTIHSTLLTGNSWRPALHAIGDVYNRGRKTRQASYANVARIP